MTHQIRLRDQVRERKIESGRQAALAGLSRDSHAMNPGSPAITDFYVGYDSVAANKTKVTPMSGEHVDVRQECGQ